MTVVAHTFEIAKLPGRGRDSRIPGGPPTLEGTVLKAIADGLNPGQWHVFSGATAIGLPDGFSSFSNAYLFRSLGNSSDQWGPVHDWDATTLQSFCIVDRTSAGEPVDRVAFGGYDAVNHRWLIRPLPGDGLSTQYFGRPHVYSSWTLARDRQKYYRPHGGLLHEFDLVTQSWSNKPMTGSLGAGTAYLEGSGKIYGIGSTGVISALDVDTGIVSTVGTASGWTSDGTHAHGFYNATRNEVMLFAQSRHFVIVNASGVVQSGVAPADVDGSGVWRHSAMFHDPLTGNYLYANRSGNTFYEYSPTADEWRSVFVPSSVGFPWAAYDGFSIASVPELGASLWFDRNVQRVYKHASAF